MAPLFIHAQHDSVEAEIEKRISFLLDKNNAGTLDSLERMEIRNLTYLIQNKGFNKEEVSNDYFGALVEIDKALRVWQLIGDSAGEANLLKYRGYLLGHLGRFQEAKKEIASAVSIYEAKGMDFGIAVSHFDLSKVFEKERLLDSSLYFARKAADFWRSRNDTFRILTGENQLIHLLTQTGNYIEALSKQKFAESLLAKTLHWRPIIDFYCVSANLYGKLKRRRASKKYSRLYRDQVDLLQRQNLVPKTTFGCE